MGKSLFIAEKPSVAQEFAKALKVNTQRHDGYLESENTVITWCVGIDLESLGKLLGHTGLLCNK